MNIIKNFTGHTPPGWRIVRNICIFVGGIMALIINSATQIPELGVTATTIAWMNLSSGIVAFIAIYAQGQAGGDPPPAQ